MTAGNHVVGPDGHVDVDVLSDLVEGMLPAAEAAEAEAHAAGCAECRETRDALAEVRELLAGQPAEPMPDDVFVRIRSALADAAVETASEGAPDGGPPGDRAGNHPHGSGQGAGHRGEAEVPPPRLSAVPDLGSLPPPRPRPYQVPEASDRVVHLHARRRKANPGLLVAAAAVAAVLVFVGVVVGGGLGSSSSDNADSKGANAPVSEDLASSRKPGGAGDAPPNAAAPSASSAAALPEYRDETLRSQVDALVTRQTAPGIGSAESTGQSTAKSPAGPTKSGTTVPEVPSASGAKQAVPSCVAQGAADKALGRQPIAAERARYRGQVAYVLVYAASGRTVDVVIVAAGCDGAGQQSATRSPSAPEVLLSRNLPAS